MTAPLNGTLLNGGTPYATWAWGWSRARATATAEPVINRVYSDARGVSEATATSSINTDRLAFLNGEEQPYATTAMAAIRYAYVNAQAVATTDTTITPVRTAWFDGSDLITSAVSSAYAERWKIVAANAYATSQEYLFDASTVIYRRANSKKLPALARSWVAESRIKEIHVRQIYAKSDAVARARSRALANTALGFGDMQLDAVTSLDNLKTNIYHNYRGLAHIESVASVDSSRIRIIEGGMPCTATIYAAPTITTATGRYSYNSGLSEAKTLTQATSKILRKAIPLNVPGISEGVRAETYLVRGIEGAQKAEASLFVDASSFTRVRASKEQTTAAAVTVASFNRYKWTPVLVTASEAQAVSYSINSVAAYSNEVAFLCYALTEANYVVERWQDSVAFSDGKSTAVSTRLAGVDAKPTAIADVIEAAVRIAYLDSDITSEAASSVTEVRRGYVDGTTSSEAAAAAVAERTAWMGYEKVSAWAKTVGDNMRWARVDGQLNGAADALGDNLRTAYLNGSTVGESLHDIAAVRTAYVGVAVESVAEIISDADRTAWMSHKTVDAWAEVLSDNSRLTYAENYRDTAVSGVAIRANIYTMRYWGEQVLEASAEEWGDPWRITTALPVSEDAASVVLKFIYRVNVDALAPDSRSILLSHTERELLLPPSDREYRIQ